MKFALSGILVLGALMVLPSSPVQASIFGDTIPSPGIRVGITARDIQNAGLMGRQIAAKSGSETVHFVWTMQDHIPVGPDIGPDFYDYRVNYGSWNKAAGVLNHGLNGAIVSTGVFSFNVRGGVPRIDVAGDNTCHATFQQALSEEFPGSTWHLYFPIEGSALFLESELPDPPSHPNEQAQFLPAIAVGSVDGANVRHIFAEGEDVSTVHNLRTRHIWYWRYDERAPAPVWEGPVLIDSSFAASRTIDAWDGSERVAMIYLSNTAGDGYNEQPNIVYRESAIAGLDWLDGSALGPEHRNFITTYDDENGPFASGEFSIAYDYDGTLHAVYVAQLVPQTGDRASIFHWSSLRGTVRMAVLGDYPDPHSWAGRLNLCQLSLGIGDGSTPCAGGAMTNDNYLYLHFAKQGGMTPEEQADTSLQGFSNGELYLSVSADGGDYWSAPMNLTNTKSPNCSSANPDSACASETGNFMARDVSDIEILYIRDYEAGGLAESGFTMNDVMYLSLPGGTTDDPYLCASPPPVYEATLSASDNDCGGSVLRSGGNDSLALAIWNSGPGVLTVQICLMATDPPETGSWLAINDADSAQFSTTIDDSTRFAIRASADTLPPGVYEGLVLVTHNDHLQYADSFAVTLIVDWCPCHGDPQCDGSTNVLDVVHAVNIAFKGAVEITDPLGDCAVTTTDVDCSGFTNVLDVVHLVSVAFKAGDPNTEFCHPCP